MRSAMPMAMGAVTDFGASDITMDLLAPNSLAMAIADATAVAEPASSATATATPCA